MPNLPISPKNTQEKVAKFFDEYYSAPLEFPSNEVDAVIGFFENRGFEKISAQTVGSVLMRQAKIDNIKIFELLDTLKGLDGTQLSYIVTEVLNNNRVNTSSLGYKVESPSDLSEKRNIVV